MIQVRKAVQAMQPYVPGKPAEEVRRELGLTELVKLNQNENPLGPSPRALAAAQAALASVHTYPEGTCRALRQQLAAMWELPEDWFLVGNGSDEVFRLLAECYLEPGDCAVVPAPSFAGYPLVAELMQAEVVRVPLVPGPGGIPAYLDLPAMARAAVEHRAKIVFLCRPHNPTGTVFSEQAFHAFMQQVPPDVLVVVDEAYREFDESPFDSRDLVTAYPNVVVTRTFSKIYGLAGLRLGYGVMRPELARPLYTARDPFSVNALAVAAGLGALADQAHLDRTRQIIRKGKAFLYALFDRLGLTYLPSQANFVLFDAGRPAAELCDALLRRGVLVRPCTSFGLPTCLRVTVGTEAENRRFAEALEAVMGNGRPAQGD